MHDTSRTWTDRAAAATAAGRRAAVACTVCLVFVGALVGAESPLFASPTGPSALDPSPSADLSPSPDPSPSPSPTGPPTVASTATGQWSDSAVEVLFSTPGWDPALVLTYWSLDGAEWVQGTGVVVRAPKDHTNDGSHSIEFYSIDPLAGPGPTGAIEVGIDTRRPRLAWRRLSPNPAGDRRFVRAVFTAGDISPVLRVTYVVEDAWGWRVARHAGFVRHPGRCKLRVALHRSAGGRLLPGLYRVTVTVTDQAGNHATSRPRVLRVERPVTASVWRRIPGSGMRVALTFDDGHCPGAWSSILKTLKGARVQATFFVNGVHVAHSPSLARCTVAGGHAIGSHTFSHQLLTTVGADRVYREVVNDRRVWWRVARASPLPLVRPPYGACDATTRSVVGRAGYARIILWDVDPADWQSPSSATIVQRVLSHVRPGSIVLLHLQPNTAGALPAILSGLRARGLRPVTVPALFRAAGRPI